jgi:hypothetical protein
VPTVRICTHAGSINPRRSPNRSNTAPRAPATTPPRTPYPICSTTSSTAPDVRDRARLRLGDREGDEEHRHADPVVEAALDVEALADSGGQAPVGHDRLAERGVGRSEHDREHSRLRQRQVVDQAYREERTKDDRERKADSEQTERHGVLPAQRSEVDPRGVREEDERQRRLREQPDDAALDLELDPAEHLAPVSRPAVTKTTAGVRGERTRRPGTAA